MTPRYLLDTNILVHFARRDRTWSRIQQKHSLLLIDPQPIVCIVSAGELRSLAVQFGWQSKLQDQMEFALGYFEQINIDRETILKSYATIDSYVVRSGRKMGKNDLWIAATARVLGAKILTTDRDFDDISPNLVEVDRFVLTPTSPGTP
jgi:tRNA(fMet)-specific endonuclease VapC